MCEGIKVKLATVVEGNLKAPFSIATTQRCGGGHYSFPWIAPTTLDMYLIMLSVKHRGIKYQFKSVWYDPTWDWTPVSWTIGEHYPLGQWANRHNTTSIVGESPWHNGKSVASKLGTRRVVTAPVSLIGPMFFVIFISLKAEKARFSMKYTKCYYETKFSEFIYNWNGSDMYCSSKCFE